jgi:hypothetical protein
MILNDILSLSLLFLIPVAAISYSGETDNRILKILLGALKRLYLNEPPLVPLTYPALREYPQNKDYPADVKLKLITEFLDMKTLAKLSKLNRENSDFVKDAVYTRLSGFHPYLFTEDLFVNHIIFCILNSHFPDIRDSFTDKNIHDNLQLLSAKYHFNDLDFSLIPRNIYHYVICFLFELIYKSDLYSHRNKWEFLGNFVCSFRGLEHSMEQSYAYVLSQYQAQERESELDMKEFYSEQVQHLEFFHSNPSLQDIKSRFKIVELWNADPVRSIQSSKISNEFVLAILEAALHEFSNEQLFNVYWHFNGSSNYHFSSELVKLITSKRDLLLRTINLRLVGKYFEPLISALEQSGVKASYRFQDIYQITPTMPLYSLPCDCNYKFLITALMTKTYSLAKIDALAFIIRIGLTFLYFCGTPVFSNSIIVEILVKDKNTNYIDSLIEPVFELARDSVPFAIIFLNLLRTNDPFVLLYFPFKILQKLKYLIQDKFDLNLQYVPFVDREFKFRTGDIGYHMQNASAFSFKAAILSSGLEELKSILSSNPLDFDDIDSSTFKDPILKHPEGSFNAKMAIIAIK